MRRARGADRHRRIHVATRDRSARVGQTREHQSKGQRSRHHPRCHRALIEFEGEHQGDHANRKNDQHRRSD